MWISLGIWLSRLLWNKFRITDKVQNIVLSYLVSVETRQLTLNFISKPRNDRHNLIRQMVRERFSNKQIADFLNKKGLKTPRGECYYAELVGATWSKLKKRDLRNSSITIKFIEAKLYKVEDDGEI